MLHSSFNATRTAALLKLALRRQVSTSATAQRLVRCTAQACAVRAQSTLSAPLATAPQLAIANNKALPNLLPVTNRRLNGSAAPELQVDDDYFGDPLYDSDLVVVLDLDECLIHSKFLEPHAAKLAHQLPHSAGGWKNDSSAMVDRFSLTLPDGEIVHVHQRPFLLDFLQQVCTRFETHIFTAAMDIYANPVLDRLDPTNTLFAKRWFRESCRQCKTNGAYVKDLRFLSKPNERLVLVDNNPLSFLANPQNGILVKSFYDDPHDNTLVGVYELLLELDAHRDVRPVLEERFALQTALKKVMYSN